MSALTRGVKLLEAPRVAEKYAKVKTADGLGYKRTMVGYISGNVEVWVDAPALFGRLASKALQNASGKASALQGAVVVIARNRKEGKPK